MPKKIGTILPSLISREHTWKIKLFNSWEKIIGNLKSKVRIEKIDKQSLILGVCHPTWAQELFFLSPMLKQKINALFKEEKIKKIQFKTIKFPEKKPKTNDNLNKQKKTKPIEQCLSITEHNKLQTISSGDLRNALESFYIRCKQTDKKK